MRKSVVLALSLVGVVTAIACASKAPSFINAEPDGGPHADGGLPDGAVAPGDAAPPDGAAPDPGYTSGSRLRARVYASSDGAEQLINWYDNARKEVCNFQTAADGVIRCLPSGISIFYYADAGCTQPLAYQVAGCAAPGYVTLNAAVASCGTYQLHVYASGGKATPPSTLFYKAGATCTSAGAASSAIDYYSVGAEIPASSFQDATIVVK